MKPIIAICAWLVALLLCCCGRTDSGAAAPQQTATVAATALRDAEATPTPRPALRPTLQTASGDLSLGMQRALVAKTLGQPDEQGIVHGQGGTAWRYHSGIAIAFWDTTDDAPIASILVTPPFSGSTEQGFRLGDSQARFRDLYQGYPISSYPNQCQIMLKKATYLIVDFDQQDRATSIHYVQNAP